MFTPMVGAGIAGFRGLDLGSSVAPQIHDALRVLVPLSQGDYLSLYESKGLSGDLRAIGLVPQADTI